MTFWIDRIRLALDSLRDNARRTLLSLLGITIGIAAVITVGTASRSANGIVYAELESFGLSTIWVSRDYGNADPDKRSRPGSGITTKDYLALQSRCCENIERLTAIIRNYGSPTVQNGNNFSNADLRGVDLPHLEAVNDALIEGRFIREADVTGHRRVAVLAPKAREELFARATTGIGESIRINGQKFTVVGLLADKSRDFLSSIGSVRNNANSRVLIPYTTYQKLFATKDVSYVQAKAASLGVATQTGEDIIAHLSHITRDRFAYRSDTMHEYIRTADRILGTVEWVGIVAASISLLVGGMGIANIMSTAVVERTREIGLRKAVGARARDIQLQFLLEASLVSLLGGVIGTALGVGLVSLASVLYGVPALDMPVIVSIALVSSIVVGIAAGFLPSRRAARLDPVTALRYE